MEFSKGTRVRIIGGDFQHFEGIVRDQVGDVVTVVLTIFGRPTPIQVAASNLEAAPQGDEQE